VNVFMCAAFVLVYVAFTRVPLSFAPSIELLVRFDQEPEPQLY